MKNSINEKRRIKGNVVVVLENVITGKKRTYVSKNIVTDAGDLFYSERGALLSLAPLVPIPTNFTDATGVPDMIMMLFDNTPANNAPAKTSDRSDLLGTLIPGSDKVIDATYPQVNDPDADNTGSGLDIITYRVSYTTAEAINPDSQITDQILTNPSPAGSEPVINHAEFTTPFDKTVNDTMKVFVNHETLGV